MKRIAILVLLGAILTGCAQLPPGDYVAYPGEGQIITPVTIEAQGYHISVENPFPSQEIPTYTPWPTYTQPPSQTPLPTYTPYPTYTPGGFEPTQEITEVPTVISTSQPECVIRILGSNVVVRDLIGGTAIGAFDAGIWVEGHEFYYTAALVEFARVTGPDRTNGQKPVTGWIQVSGYAEYDPEGGCYNMPSSSEIPIPTVAPTATPEPTQELPTECRANNKLDGAINIRNFYAIDQPIVGQLAVDQSVPVGHIYEKSSDESWALVTFWVDDVQKYGWVALKYASDTIATLTGDCSHIGRGPVADGGPFLRAPLQGAHFTLGISVALAIQTAPYLDITKCLPTSTGTCHVIQDHNPDVIYIYRDTRAEYPTHYQLENDPDGYAKVVLALRDPRADYIEIMNEAPYTPEEYDLLPDFLIRVGEVFNREGVCMLVPSFGPGNPPDFETIIKLVKFFRWANDHPCGWWPDGTPKYHGFSFHQPPWAPPNFPFMGPWLNDMWLSGRMILNDERMIEATGFGFADFMGPKIATELGCTDGGCGLWGVDPTPEQDRILVRETLRVFAEYPYLWDGFCWWTFGKMGIWTDSSDSLPYMFER